MFAEMAKVEVEGIRVLTLRLLLESGSQQRERERPSLDGSHNRRGANTSSSRRECRDLVANLQRAFLADPHDYLHEDLLEDLLED